MNELVQQRDPSGETYWVRKDTGELVSGSPPRTPSPAREMLYELEPLLYDKLNRNAPMTWFEIGRCVDVLSRAATMETMKRMMTSRSLHEFQACLRTMLQAKAVCDRMNPLSPGANLKAKRGEAQIAAKSMLTLPG